MPNNPIVGLFGAGFRLFGRVTPYLFTRLVVFLALVFFGGRSPSWAKGIIWFTVFLVGIWTLLAIIRDSRRFLDFLVPKLAKFLKPGPAVVRARDRFWRMTRVLCAVAILAVTIGKSAPLWHYMATTSLVEDEISSIASYTSRGFVPAVTTYKLAKNHILFNVVNSFIPGSGSTLPIRARAVSFLSVLAAFVLLVGYSWRRGWLLVGLIGAGLMVANDDAMMLVLQARGYGMLCLFSMVGSIALAEWLRTRRNYWLTVMAVACVAGTYTLPFFIVFGGGLLLFAYLHRPSKDTFLAGFISLVAIAMLYLPVVESLYGVFTTYDEQYGDTFISGFSSIKGVFQALQYFIPDNCLQVTAPICFLIGILAVMYLTVGERVRRYDRTAFAGVGFAILAFFIFCLVLGTVPIRVAAFLTAPMAFLVVLAAGSLFAERPFFALRPLPEIAFILVGTILLWRSEGEAPSLAKQNWREIGIFIDHAFSPQIRIWTGGKHGKQLQWNLASRRNPEGGDLDREALAQGKLVAVESAYGARETAEMLRWTDLAENVRFVTYPLQVNYQRVFFTPPEKDNIASIQVGDHPLPLHVDGRQPSDPFLLARSLNKKDVIYDMEEAGKNPSLGKPRFAEPEEIKLPAELVAVLEAKAPAGSCNLLFTQGLEEKLVTAEIQDEDGNWHRLPDIYIMGELASVVVPRDGCKAIKLHVSPRPGSKIDTVSHRPAFGLLDAWYVPR